MAVEDTIGSDEPPRKRVRSPTHSPTRSPVREEATNNSESHELTREDAAMYDRQIRIWGLNSQQRLRRSKVLVVGCTSASGEVVKNLVLAGVGSVTLVDGTPVDRDDVASQFFLRAEDLGMPRATAVVPRAQLLNPRVKVTAVTDYPATLPASFFIVFDAVCICNGDLALAERVSTAARQHARRTKVWACALSGACGIMLSDLGAHYEFETETRTAARDGNVATTTATRSLRFPPLSALLRPQLDLKALVDADGALDISRVGKSVLRALNPTLLAFIALCYGAESLGATPTSQNVDLAKRVLHEGHEPACATRRKVPLNSKARNESDSIVSSARKYLEVELGVPRTLVDNEQLQSVWRTLGVELGFVGAIVGGMLSQDVLKVLGAKGVPIRNVFVLDAFSFRGGMLLFPPETPVKAPVDEEIILSD